MSDCLCSQYTAPLTNLDEVRERYAHTPAIKATLDHVAGEPDRWVKLYRCRECGQFWQSSWADASLHTGGHETLFQTPPLSAEEWTAKPFPDQVAVAAFAAGIQQFMDRLGEETGPEICQEDGCSRLRVAQSAFCRVHHVKQLQESGVFSGQPRDTSKDRVRLWIADGPNILDKETLTKIEETLERAPIIVEHWFYYGSRAPERLIFDDYEYFQEYLAEKARPGDSFHLWDFGALCRNDNELAHGKYPNDEGCVPRWGAY